MCWFDWTGYNQATAKAAAGQEFTLNLGSGYTASFTLTQRPLGAREEFGVSAEPASGSPNAEPACPQAGSYQYINAPGNSRLYTDWAGTCGASPTAKGVNLTLGNITVTDPAGKPVTGYSIVTRDAEVSASGEEEAPGVPIIEWQSDAPLTVFSAVPEGPTAGCENPPPGAGTTALACSPNGGPGYNLALQATDAKTISAHLVGKARTAVAFGIQTAHVTLAKTVSGREKASDAFSLSNADAQGTTLASAGTGAGNSASTERTTVMPLSGAGGVYTLAEAGGSGTLLSDYAQAWSCSNAEAGSTTALPSGSGTSKTVSPIAGDDISCLITNSASADLSVVKSATPSTAVPGENETYTLVAKNNGPNPAAEAVVSDPLPSGLTFVSASPGCNFASGKVTCAAGTMAPGETKTFTVTAKVASSLDHRIENTARIDSPTPDPEPKNNESTITTPIGPKADLQIIKTASTSSVAPGGQVIYTLVVNNNGPSDATGVTVDDTLPAGLTLVSAKPSQGSCSGTKCNLGSIADGGSAQILVTAEVSKSAAGNIKNTAKVTGDQPDPEPKNNEDTSTVTIPNPPPPPQPESDLKIVKTASQAKVYPGQELTYTLTVSNLGPDTATGVNITDTPSLSLKTLSAKASQGTCKVGRPLTCALGTLAKGKSVTIKVVAEVTDVGVESNAASVTSSSKDPNPGNNLDAARTKVVPILRLKKSATPGTVKAGGEVTYHLMVTNPMIIAAHGVKVCDSLPAGLAYVSSNPKVELSGGKACWTIKSLAGRKSKTITVVARALRGAGGTLTNHATASAQGVKAVKAKAAIHVIAAPPKPTPVTG